MTSPLWRLRGALLACALLLAARATESDLLPIDAFFGSANLRQPRLSPDGSKIAFLFPHEKKMALGVFDRATKDPAVRHATTEAERVIQKVGATAEPLARSLVGELAKLTRQVADAVDGRRKSEVPPPPKKDE